MQIETTPELPAGLLFTSDEMPGYSRKRSGRGFSYRLPDGTLLSCKKEKKRIASQAIPPAYRDVWICMDHRGHLQATGIDDRGRKQYRYHSRWHEFAADRKFQVLPSFACSLPAIRKCCSRLLNQPGTERDKVIAGVVSLLDRTGYRIGNSRYEKENRSYGLSSLLSRHVQETDDRFVLRFRGKSGAQHTAEITDDKLLNLIAELHDLPGQHLFRYEDEAGEFHDISTSEINHWIKEVSGGDFTAKQFRTWKATVMCATFLKPQPPPEAKTKQAKVVTAAIRQTAELLHHTPATCRKYYIHPSLLQAYADHTLYKVMNAKPPKLRKTNNSANLHAVERRVYKLIATP